MLRGIDGLNLSNAAMRNVPGFSGIAGSMG